MADFEKLPLESALEETPQVVSVVNIYSEDAKYLGDYISTLHQISRQLVATHEKLTSTYQNLAQHLKNFKPTKYIPTSDPNGELSSTLKKFAEIISEMSSMERICSSQISDGVVYPLSKCIETEFDDIYTLGPLYQSARDEVDRAISRYSRCRRKESQQEKFEATEEVFNSRKNFHYLALQYYSRLNQLQMNRQLSLLKPILCLVTAARSHQLLNQEFLNSSSNDQFLSGVGLNLKSINEDVQKERIETEELISSIVLQSQLAYYPQPPMELAHIPPDSSHSIKSGYLNVHRKYMGVMTSWERQFVFVEGGNLMVVPKNEFVGTLLLELDSTTLAHATDTDDRAHVFTVVTSKKSIILQALNDRERDEWMLTIQKLSKEGGYVKNEKPAASSSLFSGVSQYLAEKLHVSTTAASGTGGPASPSSPTSHPVGSSSSSRLMRGDIIPKDAPIIFDFLPIMEDPQISSSNETKKEDENLPKDAAGSALAEKSFSVNFLGCMEISVDTGHAVVFEVMRRILAARAIHNMFSTSHLSMTINASHMALKDPSTNNIKLQHQLKDIVFWASHSENQRLVGFIVGQHEGVKGGPFSCYVFESDDGGKEICSALGFAARQAYAHLLDQKTSQEKRREETKLLLANIAKLPDKDESPQYNTDDSVGEENANVDVDQIPEES